MVLMVAEMHLHVVICQSFKFLVKRRVPRVEYLSSLLEKVSDCSTGYIEAVGLIERPVKAIQISLKT